MPLSYDDANELIDEFDMDGDGKLDMKEFCEAWSYLMTAGSSQPKPPMQRAATMAPRSPVDLEPSEIVAQVRLSLTFVVKLCPLFTMRGRAAEDLEKV